MIVVRHYSLNSPLLPVAEEYEGKNKVKVKAMGSGAGLSEHISDDEVIFGGLRTKEGKFLCLMCASFLHGVSLWKLYEIIMGGW